MTRFTGKLLILFAVLLMPFGMAMPAEAHPSAGLAMYHCPDQQPGHQRKGLSLECTMACASALPAVERTANEPPRARPMMFVVGSIEPLEGLHPDTEIPPPKAS